MSHQLLLTTRQTTKIRSAFANNLKTDKKLSKSQISKIIQSDIFLGSWFGILGKKLAKDLAIPFVKSNWPGLVSNVASNAASNAINKFERRISGKGVLRARKGFTLFILSEDIDNIIKVIITFGCFSGTTPDFINGKTYYWKRSHESRRRCNNIDKNC